MRFKIYPVVFILFVFLFFSCNTQDKQEMPSGDKNTPHSFDSEGDQDAGRLMKEADFEYAKYKETPTDNSKSSAEKKCMETAMYLMYDAQIPPKDKYKSALKYFRIVLKLDPGNEEAKVNKDKIEEIYEQMGKPVPETEI